jgi:hypothetical protein
MNSARDGRSARPVGIVSFRSLVRGAGPAAAALAVFAIALSPASALAELVVVSHSPTLNAVAAKTTSVSITFDRAVAQASVNDNTFRVFGHWSGPARGTFSFSNGDKTVTLTPTNPLSGGETVFVNLSHSLTAVDTTTLRSAGYAFQFRIAVPTSTGVFRQIDQFSNKTGSQTRIYGAAAADFDHDGWLDLATVNEVSADVRVFLNRGDGSGLYGSMLAPEPVGVEASPNEPADFNNDGRMDLALCASSSSVVNVLLGAGDGSFSSVQTIPVSSEPHGIAPIDVDGDGDLDLFNANNASGMLGLMINNGSGVFGAATYFDAGVGGEYALAASDMNGDGITDLVTSGRDSNQIATMIGNGNGTFTPAAPQASGGMSWVVSLGDIDGDGDLDVAVANDGSGNVGVLKNNGDGTFAAPTTYDLGSHLPSVKLGDFDGDGDVDMVISSFGGGYWRIMKNDGTGAFTFSQDITAPNSPSCAVPLDFDNDGDLDLALFDELADLVTLAENDADTLCPVAPDACREPTVAGKAKLSLSRESGDDQSLKFTWGSGTSTDKSEFGDPLTAEDYELCIYEGGALVRGLRMPAGQLCPTKACWKSTTPGYSYGDNDKTPDGLQRTKLGSGADGKAKITVKGRGLLLDLPDVGAFNQAVDVQLHNTTGTICWGASFTPPFKDQDSTSLKADSDAP